MKRELLLVCVAVLLASLTRAPAATHYIDAASTNAIPPFTNWATAAAVIQDAVDISLDGDEIVVTNGVYKTGARAVNGMSNRVAVTKPLIVRSVNGPAYTSILGYGPIGDNAIRCAYLASGALLSGFTLTNGATQRTEEPEVNPVSTAGGGVWCESQSAVITNCVLAGNSAFDGGGALSGTLNNCTLMDNLALPTFFDSSGGGAYRSTLINCTLTGNWADLGGGASDCTLTNCSLTANSSPQAGGGGAAGSTLNNCTLTGNTGTEGGGAIYCTLNNCTLTGNGGGTGGGAAFSTLKNCTLTENKGDPGGGAAWSTLNNCTLTGNWAVYGDGAYLSTLTNCILSGNLAYSAFATGGGAHASTLDNCTLAGNSARGEYCVGGGASHSTLNNCIVYYNRDNNSDNYYGSTLNYSCTTPDPGSGVGNITNAPLFVDTNGWSNLRLQYDSPCINAGNNAYVTAVTDPDGLPRIAGGTVDIGAYEFQEPASVISYAWLQQAGLSTDGSEDYVDTDHDGHNNWQEWIVGTDPINALSVLRLLPLARSGTDVTLTWLSVTNRTYVLECSTNLAATPPFTTLATNLPGQPGATGWTDTNATVSSPRFYQLRVSP